MQASWPRHPVDQKKKILGNKASPQSNPQQDKEKKQARKRSKVLAVVECMTSPSNKCCKYAHSTARRFVFQLLDYTSSKNLRQISPQQNVPASGTPGNLSKNGELSTLERPKNDSPRPQQAKIMPPKTSFLLPLLATAPPIAFLQTALLTPSSLKRLRFSETFLHEDAAALESE